MRAILFRLEGETGVCRAMDPAGTINAFGLAVYAIKVLLSGTPLYQKGEWLTRLFATDGLQVILKRTVP